MSVLSLGGYGPFPKGLLPSLALTKPTTVINSLCHLLSVFKNGRFTAGVWHPRTDRTDVSVRSALTGHQPPPLRLWIRIL